MSDIQFWRISDSASVGKMTMENGTLTATGGAASVLATERAKGMSDAEIQNTYSSWSNGVFASRMA